MLIGIVLILVLLIAYALFKLGAYMAILKGRKEGEMSASGNRTQALLLALFLVAGLTWLGYYAITYYDEYIIAPASEQAIAIDAMFWTTTLITVFVFVATHVLLFYFAYRYRADDSKKRAYFYPENNRLELLWTAIPALVLAVLIFNGLRHWVRITGEAPADAHRISLVGYQFAWAARYPGPDKTLGRANYQRIDAENRTGIDFSDPAAKDDFMPRMLYLPKGEAVVLDIGALDVIHNVYFPHFKMQMYAIPGMNTTLWFTPNTTTAEMREATNNPEFNYELACNKICGSGHFAMRMLVVVVEPDVYRRWYDEQKPWLERHPDYILPEAVP